MAKKTKPHDKKLKDRKDAIKPKSKKFNIKYIDRHATIANFITAVYCKGCGTQIKGLNRDNSLIPFWNYRELTIDFDNDTSHMTPICAKCNVTDPGDLEALYITDLEEFDLEDETGSNTQIWDYYLDRIPVKKKKEKYKKPK